MIRSFAVLACLALASPSLAACPDPAALDGDGIVMAFDDGGVGVLRRQPDNLVREDNIYQLPGEDFYHSVGIYERGLIPVVEFELNEAGETLSESVYTTTYASDPLAAFDLAPGESLTVDFAEEGPASDTGTLTILRGEDAPFVLGDCETPAIAFTFKKTHSDGSWIQPEFAYLTDYGVAIFMRSTFDDGSTMEFAPVSWN
ncbi:hypothetical protein [Roseisalinus antarcticus]|uniref:Uncharacterized protein n=1 Tax=Roseisalinus antarcticus TaxID=254357 RepID=A0A1Y5TSD1_9RHOB|nr:hypothetical protein [Roseisalinus antarcticus]SLN71110.1 hypothetical protein ROA7023_03503 [Roseisalinus antarcticus]